MQHNYRKYYRTGWVDFVFDKPLLIWNISKFAQLIIPISNTDSCGAA